MRLMRSIINRDVGNGVTTVSLVVSFVYVPDRVPNGANRHTPKRNGTNIGTVTS